MKNIFKKYGVFTLGTLLSATGIHFFKFPNHFSTGGVSGLAVILNYFLSSISTSDFAVVLNVLTLLLGFIFIGKTFSIKTIYCSLTLSLFLYIFEKVFLINYPLTNQPVLELFFAVLLPTVGEALLFYYGGSSGGTDIVAMILKKYSSIRIGNALFVVDVLIVVVSSLCYGIQVGLLSFLGLIAKTFLIDKIIERLNLSVSCLLITNCADIVCNYITKELNRGVTIVNCIGGFTGKEKKVIITVLKYSQVGRLKKQINALDKEAFLITGKTSDICGKGFSVLI